jgi:hypothetical protein
MRLKCVLEEMVQFCCLLLGFYVIASLAVL